MDSLEELAGTKVTRASRVSVALPKGGAVVISMHVGGSSTKDTAAPRRDCRPLPRSAKAGKRLGASEVIKAVRA